LKSLPAHKRNTLLTGDPLFEFDPVVYEYVWSYQRPPLDADIRPLFEHLPDVPDHPGGQVVEANHRPFRNELRDTTGVHWTNNGMERREPTEPQHPVPIVQQPGSLPVVPNPWEPQTNQGGENREPMVPQPPLPIVFEPQHQLEYNPQQPSLPWVQPPALPWIPAALPPNDPIGQPISRQSSEPPPYAIPAPGYPVSLPPNDPFGQPLSRQSSGPPPYETLNLGLIRPNDRSDSLPSYHSNDPLSRNNSLNSEPRVPVRPAPPIPVSSSSSLIPPFAPNTALATYNRPFSAPSVTRNNVIYYQNTNATPTINLPPINNPSFGLPQPPVSRNPNTPLSITLPRSVPSTPALSPNQAQQCIRELGNFPVTRYNLRRHNSARYHTPAIPMDHAPSSNPPQPMDTATPLYLQSQPMDYLPIEQPDVPMASLPLQPAHMSVLPNQPFLQPPGPQFSDLANRHPSATTNNAPFYTVYRNDSRVSSTESNHSLPLDQTDYTRPFCQWPAARMNVPRTTAQQGTFERLHISTPTAPTQFVARPANLPPTFSMQHQQPATLQPPTSQPQVTYQQAASSQPQVAYQQHPMLMPPVIPPGYALVPIQNVTPTQSAAMSREPSIDCIDVEKLLQTKATNKHLPKGLSVGEKIKAFFGDDELLRRRMSRRYQKLKH